MNRIKKLRSTLYHLRVIYRILSVFCVLCCLFVSTRAQSTNQSFPTAITANEISGRIAARDIGDARLTSYFYVFGGNQGDVFINVQTVNFNGDIDVFTFGNLKPLTKITVYADDTTSETGRVVYLRQPAKLILRIQGRSPNDDSATFRIKFAGSFEPVQAVADNPAAEVPEVKSENQTNVRVNSVGTIIEIKPKPQPSPKETIAKKEDATEQKKNADPTETKKEINESEIAEDESRSKQTDVSENTLEEKKQEPAVEKNKSEDEKENAPRVIITDNIGKPDETKTENNKTPENLKDSPVENAVEDNAETAAKSKPKAKTKKVKEPSPLENIRLVILFKDGTRIERQMSEVLKVGVDKGVLTLIAKDGSIGRYSILDVAKMTIE